jgi:hypothetical protein
MLHETGHSWDNIRKVLFLSAGVGKMLMADPLPYLEFKKDANAKHTTAWSVANRYRSKACSNPRDHVSGLAALCNFGTSYETNYSAASLTVQDVFVDFTLHCIRTTKFLEAFRAVSRSTAISKPNLLDPHLIH